MSPPLARRHEDRVGEPLVDERRVGPKLTADWTALRRGGVARRAYSSARAPGAGARPARACAGRSAARTTTPTRRRRRSRCPPGRRARRGRARRAPDRRAAAGSAASGSTSRARASRSRSSLDPPPPVSRWPELTLVAADAVAGAIGHGATIKHPNDVLVDGRKVGGHPRRGRRPRRPRHRGQRRRARRGPAPARSSATGSSCSSTSSTGSSAATTPGLQLVTCITSGSGPTLRHSETRLVLVALLAAVARARRRARRRDPSTPRVLAIHFTAGGEPGHAGLAEPPARPRAEGPLRRGRDRARHARRARGLDAEDRAEGARGERGRDARDRLRLAAAARARPRPASGSPQAADLLAMAPNTNIGSSTPIDSSGANIGSDLRRKVVNDAAASLRGLATTHGRNAAWADKAVRVASNLTAAEALKMNVIDTIAPDPAARSSTRSTAAKTVPPDLVAAHAGTPRSSRRAPGFLTRFLSTILDPNLALAALPRRDRRDRVRDLPPGRRPPGRARRGLAAARAVRPRGAADLVDRARARPPRRRCSSGSTRYVPSHGALTLSGLIALGFGLATLFHDSSRPLHDLDPARRHAHGRDRRPLGLGDLEGDRGAARSRSLVGPEDDRRDAGRRPRGRPRAGPRRAAGRRGRPSRSAPASASRSTSSTGSPFACTRV